MAWEDELGKEIPYKEYLSYFRAINAVTNITKYRSFQYRLLTRGLVTNIQLHQWGIIDYPKCSNCDVEVETYNHLYVTCKKLQNFWIKTEEMMMEYTADNIHFDVDIVLFNRIIYKPLGHVKNCICLLAKFYIYKQRCVKKQIKFNEFVAMLRMVQSCEKYFAISKNTLHKHERKWYPNKPQLQETHQELSFIVEYISTIASK